MVHTRNEGSSFANFIQKLSILFSLLILFLLEESVVTVWHVLVIFKQTATLELLNSCRGLLPRQVVVLLVSEHFQDSVGE